MCAAQAAARASPAAGAGARVADTAPQPGGHLHKVRAVGPARGPRGPALRQRRGRPTRLRSARYPLVRGGRKKGRNEGRREGGGRRCRHLRRLLLSLPLPPARPSPRSRYVPVPVASPSRSSGGGDNGPARPGPARPRTHLARSPAARGAGWDGGAGRVLARSAESLRGNFQMRGTRPERWRRRPSDYESRHAAQQPLPFPPRRLSLLGHAGSCSSWAGKSGARQSPFLARALHLVGMALLPCPAKGEPRQGESWACLLVSVSSHPLLPTSLPSIWISLNHRIQ